MYKKQSDYLSNQINRSQMKAIEKKKCNKTTQSQTEMWTDPDNNLSNNFPVKGIPPVIFCLCLTYAVHSILDLFFAKHTN